MAYLRWTHTGELKPKFREYITCVWVERGWGMLRMDDVERIYELYEWIKEEIRILLWND